MSGRVVWTPYMRQQHSERMKEFWAKRKGLRRAKEPPSPSLVGSLRSRYAALRKEIAEVESAWRVCQEHGLIPPDADLAPPNP